MLTNQTRAALVQVLQAISPDATRLLLIKHLNIDLLINIENLLAYTASADSEHMAGLLVELLSDNTDIRSDAPTKRTFDKRLNDLRGRLRADGFEVIEEAMTRLMPAAEPAAQINDHLEQTLKSCNLDTDGEVRRLLRESHASISATPPDFNDGTTKARIAMETIARRSATRIASIRSKSPPPDSWGAALNFLRVENAITQVEEEAIAKVYTLISPGAHVPKGLTDEQWALLARTFAVSGAYFLTRLYLAVT